MASYGIFNVPELRLFSSNDCLPSWHDDMQSSRKQFDAQKPRQGDDERQRFISEHPMNSMVADFLALEEQARGTSVGYSCLYHLVLTAGGVGDADDPATEGKVSALKVLGQHYHNYPDIDTVFSIRRTKFQTQTGSMWSIVCLA